MTHEQRREALFFVAEKLGMTAEQAGTMTIEEHNEWVARFAMKGENVLGP